MATRYFRTQVLHVAWEGGYVDPLIPARVREEALHAIDAGRVGKSRVYRAACVYGGFKVRLVFLVIRIGTIWTARVTSSMMRGGILSDRDPVVGRIGGGSTLGDGGALGRGNVV